VLRVPPDITSYEQARQWTFGLREASIRAGAWLSDFGSRNSETTPIGNTINSPALPCDYISELEKMDPVQKQLILDELADRPDLWDEESEVLFL